MTEGRDQWWTILRNIKKINVGVSGLVFTQGRCQWPTILRNRKEIRRRKWTGFDLG